jgi:hypothetical protein
MRSHNELERQPVVEVHRRAASVSERSNERPGRSRSLTVAAPLVLIVTAMVISSHHTSAQERKKAEPAKAADIFADDARDEKNPDESKIAPGGSAKAPAVTDRDAISFTQENATAQMNELEVRMFRLSEALASLEPENASRLRLALKFSREEVILGQMKETEKLLKEAQLAKAETEVRELLAKLEHLRRVLLAEDLDFQMKLARLRQMRETMTQLERIISEEKRELAWSRQAIDNQGEVTQLRSRKGDLEALVRDQKTAIDDMAAANQQDSDSARKEARRPVRDREDAIRQRAAKLAADPRIAGLRPEHLKQAGLHLDDAIASLSTSDGDAAIAAERRALASFQQALDGLSTRLTGKEKDVALSEFQRFEHDQNRNRGASDSLASASARLGDSGVNLQKDLIRASGSMRAAEGDLARTAAKPAADDQFEALKHLSKSHDELARSLESLLIQLRAELQGRIHVDLIDMHEAQKEIRETTEAQAPRVAQKSRAAEILVAGLARKEAELADTTEELTTLAEETQFGIALPTALRVLGREMRTVQGWLAESDASPRTVKLEKRIEQDLLSLMEAMRGLPPTSPPSPGSPLPSERRARERELNRLIAELKMIRLLQTRLNDDTVEVDQGRPRTENPAPALKREIEALKVSQVEIRDSFQRVGAPLEAGQAAGESTEGESSENASQGPVSKITRKMTGVADDLSQMKTGEPVQAKEKAIISDLDELLAQMEKERQGAQNGNKESNPSRPATASAIRGGPGGIGDLVAPGGSHKDWAKLSGHERDRILQSMTEGFPPEYRLVLERYYRRLAEEKAAPAGGESPKK